MVYIFGHIKQNVYICRKFLSNSFYLNIVSTMKRNLSVLTICLVALLSLTSCLNKMSNAAIKEIANQTNAECPMQIDQMIILTGVKLDGNYFVYNYEVDETIAPLEKLEDMGFIDRDKIIIKLTESEDAEKLMNLLQSAGKTLRYQYRGVQSGKELTLELLPSEVLDFDKSKIDNIIKEKLMASLEETNANCPIQIDEITYLNEVEVTDNTFCYHYSIDEEKISLSLLKENVESLKAGIRANAFDENSMMYDFVNTCKRTGYSILYQYEGSISNDVFQLKLNLEDETVEMVE